MPTLRITWTRQDTSNPFPGGEDISTNVIAGPGTRDVVQDAMENFAITHTITETTDGLQKITDYVGSSADLQDFVAQIEPHLNDNFDNTESLFNISMDVDVIPDPD